MKGNKLNIFQRTAMRKPKQSTFDLSHDHKTSFNMGELVPTTVMDVIPGDRITIGVENMLRFAPLVSPVMHKVRVATHYFFVPNRLLWPEWDQWVTGDSDVEPPYFRFNNMPTGSLGDYLGFNLSADGPLINTSPLAVAAYNLIYDDFYRDQNLQDKVFEPLIPGNNANYVLAAATPPQRRAWQHDYFTSCLPFAQKGDEVLIPIGDFNDVSVDLDSPDGAPTQLLTDANSDTGISNTGLSDMATNNAGEITYQSGAGKVNLDPNGTLKARTSELTAEAASITNLRRAFRLQEWLERNARGGTRYVENILSHFGVRSKDSRMNRPEFIGSSRQNMTISEVLSTAQTVVAGGENPVGQMAGHGVSIGGGNQFSYTATEHGFIMGIISVTPDTAYQQGIPRMHTRFDRLDYAWPTFAHIGEQPVLNKEVYHGAGATEAQQEETFGYIPRYSEYRYMPSRVSGLMRTELAYWHLGRIFDNPPQLNEEFIECEPSKRIFAVTEESEDTIYAHIFNNIRATRKLPKYGTPHM